MDPRLAALGLLLSTSLSACGDSTSGPDDELGDGSTDTDSSTTTEDGSSTTTDDDSSTDDSSTTADSSTETTDETTDDTTETTDTTDVSGECGNGVIEDAEQCDGGDVGGATCQSEGFGGGGLSCTADCMLDTSTCTNCGDGIVNDAEECDGADLGMFSTCDDVNLGTAMELLACNGDCTYDYGMCSGCGDGVITDPEDCEPEGPDLGGMVCMDLGFDDGMLDCSEGCSFNTVNCYSCGDAVQQGNEECDGADFDNLTCGDFLSPSNAPFDSGSLTCVGDCTIDTNNCSLCGDGVVSGAEICEPGVLGGETCTSQGFDDGSLGCMADCSGYDTSACTDCGDAMVEGNEQCEGNDLANQTCNSLGFVGGGTLACTVGCLFDTNACTNDFCGDGLQNGNDQCDCGNQGINCSAAQLGNETCATQGFSGGALACNSPNNCLFDTSACYSCGDGNVNPGESCDGINLDGQTCVSQGFNGGGTLSCDVGCAFDTAQCVAIANPYTACATPNSAMPGQGLGVPSIINVPVGGTVTDIDVTIDALHTRVGDLNWTLNKAGTNRVLINRVVNGVGNCTGDNINVTLDDEAGGGPVQSQCNVAPPAIDGTRTPNATLDVYDNATMIGDWTLQSNDFVQGVGGTFHQWCITIAWQ